MVIIIGKRKKGWIYRQKLELLLLRFIEAYIEYESVHLLLRVKLSIDDDWILVFRCGRHNHNWAQYLKGHSFVSCLSQEKMSMLSWNVKKQH